MRATACSLVGCLLAPSVLASNVVVVGSGPGQTSSIQAAVDAAPTGTILLVKSGTYAGALVTNKSLTIVADDGATVAIQGAMRVEGLAPEQTVMLSGLVVDGVQLANQDSLGCGLYTRNCAGQIVADSCTFRAKSAQWGPGPYSCVTSVNCAGVDIGLCAAVALTGCTMRGSNTLQLTCGDGVRVDGPGLTSIERCVASGGASNSMCLFAFWYDGIPGGAGAVVSGGSFVWASSSTFAGGNGADGSSGTGVSSYAGNGGDGLKVPLNSPATAQLRSVTCIAGSAGQCPQPFSEWCGGGYPGYALIGFGISSIPGTPPSLMGPRIVRDSGTVTFVATATPGATVGIAFSEGAEFVLPSGSTGVRHVRAPRQLATRVSGANGTATWTLTVPNLRQDDPGRVYYVQPFVRTASTTEYGNLQTLVVLDASL